MDPSDHVAIYGPTGHEIAYTDGPLSWAGGQQTQEVAWRCQCGAGGDYDTYTGRTR